MKAMLSVGTTVCLLSLVPNVLGQAVHSPVTVDLHSTQRCEELKELNEKQFQQKCEKNSCFRFYICGKTCDSLYDTKTDLSMSKQSAVNASCYDVFTDHFCLKLRLAGKCDGPNQITGFRACLKTCGYCSSAQTVTY